MNISTWNIDAAHTGIHFAVRHMVVSKVRGRFAKFGGTLRMDEEDITRSSVDVTIDATSLDTGVADRDTHLRSPDFFDVQQYPEITFESTKIERVDTDTLRVVGNLTMHGETKEISLDAVVDGTETDPMGNERVGLEVAGQLSRGEFGMKFNQALGSGNVAVSDKVKLALDISAIKQS